MTSIEVLICTRGARIANVGAVMAAPQEGVSYLVAFQCSSAGERELVPEEVESRSDVRLLEFHDSGLSRNRNHALDAASGDILLFADDDNRYTPASFDAVRRGFEALPNARALCFQSRLYDGELQRQFLSQPFNLLDSPRGYYPRSCEIAVKRGEGVPRFDEHFGLGSGFLACGEEEVFVADMLRNGSEVWYFPAPIVFTASGTTGSQFNASAAVRRSKGAVLAVRHGVAGAVARIAKFSVLNVSGMSRVRAFADMLRGVVYAKGIGR